MISLKAFVATVVRNFIEFGVLPGPARTRTSRPGLICLSPLNPQLSTTSFPLPLLLFLLLSLAPPPTLAFSPWNSGPVYDQFPLTLTSGHRTEILGPLFYTQQSEDGHLLAVPPLFSLVRNPDVDSTEFDILYPLLTYDRYGEQYRVQLFQLLSMAGGGSQAETNRNRITIFPIFFHQNSSDPDQDYTAVVPFYGTLKNRLNRDEIFFVMFPAYARTEKRGVTTRNYLYPIFHLREGAGVKGWQVWPLVGHESRDTAIITNRFGDPQTVGGYEKLFVLWPIFLNQRSDRGTPNPQWQQMLLPAYYLLRSPQRDQTTVLWPFFSKIDDRARHYKEWHAPWPFVVIARGEGKTLNRYWPIYSKGHNTNLAATTIMWPVYRHTRLQSAPLDRERTRILLFLYSAVRETNTETGNSRLRRDFWPFYTWRRDWEGRERLQILAVLEPLVPNNKSIERNWSPVYSLWRAENNPETGHTSQSLLWNLYRRETSPEQKKTSFLFGLFQTRSTPESRHLRLFYIPVF